MLLKVVLCFFVAKSFGWPHIQPKKFIPLGSIIEEGPLILTPLIEEGKVEEARNLSIVDPAILQESPNLISYSGYLTVDKECGSNLFFWFFPAEGDYKSAPLSVWLQGGPGGSSLFGLFSENGPIVLKPTCQTSWRKFRWTHSSSMLYFDNPVGTGFSFANNTDCYSSNETEVGRNLLIALKQFLALFPELKQAPFFITGESYAGKYVPAFAYTIHKDNTDSDSPINLQGIAIGNGFVDPINQLNYGDYLYQIGLIDAKAREHFKSEEDLGRSYIAAGNWSGAFQVFDRLLDGDLTSQPSYFKNCTDFDFYFNYLHTKSDEPTKGCSSIGEFVNSEQNRRRLHVGNIPYNDGNEDVEKKLENDMMQSVAPWLKILMDNYRVLIYNGQLDIIVAYPLTVAYLQKLQWSAAGEYLEAARSPWYVGDSLAGYVKQAGNLTEVLVRNAGHMVPKDQPRWALDLFTKFINNDNFPSKPIHG